MKFTKKIWKDRKTEYPNRRRLTKEDGSTELVAVSREEGIISEEGDAFSAENMNNMEERVEGALMWKALKTNCMGSETVTIPADANELFIKVNVKSSGIINMMMIPMIALLAEPQSYRDGSPQNSSISYGFQCDISNSKITLIAAFYQGTNVIDTTAWNVYYR